MPALMQQGDRFYCQLMYTGKRHCFALGKVSLEEGERKTDQVAYLLMRLKQGYLKLPPGTDIVTFLKHDGKPPEDAPGSDDKITLGKLRDEYLKAHQGSLEETTISGIRLHFGHLVRLLGKRFPMTDLSQTTLQDYANKRSKMKWRGRTIRSATIKKELI
jgi:hypothetical protein